MIPIFDIFLKMLEFVAPFNAKIVIMINVTRFVILDVIRKGRYSGSIPQWNALFNFSIVDKQIVTGFRHAVCDHILISEVRVSNQLGQSSMKIY